MNLFLIRHGDAEKSVFGQKDSERKLTEKGKDSTKIAAQNWKRIIPKFDYILSSPYIRAIQTAEIIASNFNYTDKLITDNKLSCGSRFENVVELVNSLEGTNIAYVGHQPDLSNHLSDFISSGTSKLDFGKSMIAKISFRNKAIKGGGTLIYLLPVELFIE